MSQTAIVPAAPMREAAMVRRMAMAEELVEKVAISYPVGNDDDRHKKALRLFQQAYIYIESSPDELKSKILACSNDSVIDALSSCASYDLELHRTSNEAHLVPFKNSCTLMIGYEGIVKLILRTKAVSGVYAEVIYKGEPYRIVGGTSPNIEHEIRLECRGREENIVGAYAVMHNIQGPPAVVPLSKPELDKARSASKAKNGPWNYWYSSMAIKTALLRLKKFIPKTGDPEAIRVLAKAIDHEHKQFGLLEGYAEDRERHVQEGRVLAAEALTDGDDRENRPVTAAEKVALRNHVKDLVAAAGGPSDIVDTIIFDAIRDSLDLEADAPPKIATLAELKKVRESLGRFDMATGEVIPESVG